MLLSIVLIKYKTFNFAQGSRLLTILTYSYTIKNNISLKYHLLWKCYKSLHINIGNKGDCWFYKLCVQNIGIIFVENPPGIYELPFLFSFHSWRNYVPLISFHSQTEITNLLLLLLMDSFWFWLGPHWHEARCETQMVNILTDHIYSG